MIDSKVTPWILSNLERLQKLCYRKRKELGSSKSLQSIWAAKDFFTEILKSPHHSSRCLVAIVLIKVLVVQSGKALKQCWLSWNSFKTAVSDLQYFGVWFPWFQEGAKKTWLKVTGQATWRILREWLTCHVFWTGTFGSGISSDSCLGCTVILRERSLRLLLS